MIDNRNIFLEKKILIYGLGKSGLSSYKFLVVSRYEFFRICNSKYLADKQLGLIVVYMC